MKLEDLDTLLRNKLQFKEAEVSPSEKDGVFAAFGLQEKKKKKPFLAWAGIVGSLLLGMVILWNYSPQVEKKANSAIQEINTNLDLSANQDQDAANDNQLKEEVKDKTEQETTAKTNLAIAPSTTNKINARNIENAPIKLINSNKSKIFNDATIIEAEGSEKVLIRDQVEPIELLSESRNIKTSILQSLEWKPSISAKVEMPALPSNSQTYSKTEKLLKYFNPQLSFYSTALGSMEQKTAEANSEDYIHKEYFNNYNTGNRRSWSLNTGVDFKINLFGFLNLGSGIGVINTGSSFNYDFLINDIPVEDSATGFIFGYITKPDSTSQRISEVGAEQARYLEIPIQVNFKLLSYKSLTFGLEGAYTFQRLLKTEGKSLNSTTLAVDNSSAYKSRLRNYQIGLPITYHFQNKTSITCMPFIGGSIGNVANNTNINTTRKFNGLQLSFNYNLIK